MSFGDARGKEGDLVAPVDSYVDVEPPTEPSWPCPQWPYPCDCAYCENRRAAEASHEETEGLDMLLLSEARRLIDDAERFTAAGMHAVALPQARRALRVLALVLSKHDGRQALLTHLTGSAAE